MFNDPIFDPERRRKLNSNLKREIDILNLEELEEVLDYVSNNIEVIEASIEEETDEEIDEEDEEDEIEDEEDEVEEKHIPKTDDIE